MQIKQIGLPHKYTFFSVYATENKYLCTVKHMPIFLSCESREERPCNNTFFDTFFSKKTFCGMSFHTTISSISVNFGHCTFTGKEKDEETGYGYFGARYMDHELMTMWLSVDPLADKYPNISPYAYCAWNPVKLVDPDGKEVDLSCLNEAIQNRIVNCLSAITGLSLYVENGILNYEKDENGNAIFSSGSQTARKDLLDAINKKNEDGSNYVISVGHSLSKCEGGQLDDKKGGIVRLYCSRLNEKEDCETNGLGMIFLHELRHAVTGEKDPIQSACDYNRMGYPNNLETGSVVDRVNEYRKELGMPIRIKYVARQDGCVPFLDVNKYNPTPANIKEHVIWKKIKTKRDE